MYFLTVLYSIAHPTYGQSPLESSANFCFGCFEAAPTMDITFNPQIKILFQILRLIFRLPYRFSLLLNFVCVPLAKRN